MFSENKDTIVKSVACVEGAIIGTLLFIVSFRKGKQFLNSFFKKPGVTTCLSNAEALNYLKALGWTATNSININSVAEKAIKKLHISEGQAQAFVELIESLNIVGTRGLFKVKDLQSKLN